MAQPPPLDKEYPCLGDLITAVNNGTQFPRAKKFMDANRLSINMPQTSQDAANVVKDIQSYHDQYNLSPTGQRFPLTGISFSTTNLVFGDPNILQISSTKFNVAQGGGLAKAYAIDRLGKSITAEDIGSYLEAYGKQEDFMVRYIDLLVVPASQRLQPEKLAATAKFTMRGILPHFYRFYTPENEEDMEYHVGRISSIFGNHGTPAEMARIEPGALTDTRLVWLTDKASFGPKFDRFKLACVEVEQDLMDNGLMVQGGGIYPIALNKKIIHCTLVDDEKSFDANQASDFTPKSQFSRFWDRRMLRMLDGHEHEANGDSVMFDQQSDASAIEIDDTFLHLNIEGQYDGLKTRDSFHERLTKQYPKTPLDIQGVTITRVDPQAGFYRVQCQLKHQNCTIYGYASTGGILIIGSKQYKVEITRDPIPISPSVRRHSKKPTRKRRFSDVSMAENADGSDVDDEHIDKKLRLEYNSGLR